MLKIILVLFFACAAANAFAQTLPAPEREFRAVWIATVDNIDFPSRRGLSVSEQKAEIMAILDKAQELKFNCVVFQIRPHTDALYESKLEPWSEYLTGEMGKSPAPFYDPLAFTVAEAHKRGLLVHAWFNPYRAYHPAAKTVSANHISKTRPDLVRQYGKYLWLDPSEPEVQKLSLDVVLDVVRRYDIDGVHFDDYFYPYPEKDASGNRLEFPDDKNWQKYLETGAKMSAASGVKRISLKRDDWRRANVNRFIETVAREVKKVKPQVMFGISPFGIWQPAPEKGIEGFNAYAELYADARLWMQKGWVDYTAPQLYWETGRKGLSFPVLLDWWKKENTLKRHLWTGIATYRVGSNENFTAQEIISQIETTRREFGNASGTIHFSMKHLLKNTGGVSDLLKSKVYRRAALIPVSPWIKTARPLAPVVKIEKNADNLKISWRERGANKAFWFVVYAEDANGWSYSILPSSEKSISLSTNRKIRQVVITNVDRLGNESPIIFNKV
jgi:uncharacterized lipoprotein YddW (UPF0748 family)